MYIYVYMYICIYVYMYCKSGSTSTRKTRTWAPPQTPSRCGLAALFSPKLPKLSPQLQLPKKMACLGLLQHPDMALHWDRKTHPPLRLRAL